MSGDDFIKILQMFLALASVLLFAGTMFLWFIVPRWARAYSGGPMSAVEQLFIILSNMSRTPLGIFATLILFALLGIVLIGSLRRQRKI